MIVMLIISMMEIPSQCNVSNHMVHFKYNFLIKHVFIDFRDVGGGGRHQ